MKKNAILFIMILQAFSSRSQVYFPPSTGNWDTLSPDRLGWCKEKTDSMLDYLGQKGTKAFIVLKDGKIVLEKYYGTFTADSIWYWASAGKSLASAMVGIAQQEGYLRISDKTSQYLGKGWTACPTAKEDLITIRHQLTMTTGLDETVSDPDCTDSACLQYKSDAGTRWFYHNAPYTLTHKVVEKATGKNFNLYTYQKISSKIGMSGLWVKSGSNDIYFSKARDMARYGILVLNKGVWQTDTIFKDKTYFSDMSQTSQQLNKSYGYLWWLNGKGQIIFPGFAASFNRDLVPSAPADMFAALGKNDQKLYIVPSQNLVVVRMGNAADGEFPALSDFDIQVWNWMNKLTCKPALTNRLATDIELFPNPANNSITFSGIDGVAQVTIFDMKGREICSTNKINRNTIELNILPDGMYYIELHTGNSSFRSKIVVQH